MPSLSRDKLRGYVLEEVLAKLIQNTGYRLLVDATQDTEELENRPNGLAVRGRGGSHQVDVLGELAWIPAFTFPLRLIVEAKARGGKSGIDVVRNAVGVVSDVNQNYARSAATRRALLQKFTYRYALFSTSGFSSPAAEYALAHQISLVDLSAPEFGDIVQLANEVTDAIWAGGSPGRGDGFVKRFRAWLRVELGTWPEEVQLPADWSEHGPRFDGQLLAVRDMLRERVEAMGELFVAMANGPFLLVLRARDPRYLVQVLDRDPVRDVSIHWSSQTQSATRWRITLPGEDDSAELTFTLPAPVAAWIFDEGADARRRAMQFKEKFLSTLTIYRFIDGRDRLYRLQFSRPQIADSWPRGRRRDE